jgi:hypothetical protein
LFGELGILKGRARGPEWQPTQVQDARPEFAVTAILETTVPALHLEGGTVDRQIKDMIVSGSAAQAMRSHFAGREELDPTSHAITLCDPMAAVAPAIVRMLSQGSGEPIERVQLRERATLRSLATIERTRLVTGSHESLKIYHADVPLDDPESAEIPIVLMERADLSAVIVGTMHPESVGLLLETLQHACLQPTWRCPGLLFVLPPSSGAMAGRITSLDWPDALHVHVCEAPTDGASGVWNEVATAWGRSRTVRRSSPAALDLDLPLDAGGGRRPTGAAGRGPGPASAAPLAPTGAATPVDPVSAGAARIAPLLRSLMEHDGLLACAVCDAASGRVVAFEARDPHLVDVDVAGVACAEALRAHRLGARSMGLGDTLAEVSIIAGARQQLVRMLRRQPGMFIFVLVDRGRANVSLIRYRLVEFDRSPHADRG